jgi:hypothetical protein
MSFDSAALAWLPRAPAEFRDRCRRTLDTSDRVGALTWLAGHALDDVQLGQLHNIVRRTRRDLGSLTPLNLCAWQF